MSEPRGGTPFLFLSHGGADTEAARQLKQRLEGAPAARERGLKVWFDKDDLRPGERWRPQLEHVIGRQATAFAVYVGSKGVVNWVEAEVDLALSRAINSKNSFRFIPILAVGVDASDALPGFASQFQAVRDVESKPDEFEKLLAALLGDGNAGSLQLEGEPFFGLKAIEEARNHLFFGRERETSELIRRLAAARLLMVSGDSGSGKSSLVRAGLVPRWRGGAVAELQGHRSDEEIWNVIETRPRGNPRRALGEAVNEAAKRVGISLSDRGTLQDWATSGDIDKVRRAVRCDLPADRTRTLLVVDQFEELWTLTLREQRQPYVDLLLVARYELLLGTIVPRPIAIITTLSEARVLNAAPYSLFAVVSHDPPILMVSVLPHAERRLKDTAENAFATREFVVNLVSRSLAEAMNVTCVDAPPEIDELELAQLKTAPSRTVGPPRIALSPVAFECRFLTSLSFGPDQATLFGRVSCVHVADEYVSNAENGVIDTPRLELIGGMHGARWYTGTSDLFAMDRPTWAGWPRDSS